MARSESAESSSRKPKKPARAKAEPEAPALSASDRILGGNGGRLFILIGLTIIVALREWFGLAGVIYQ